MHVKFGCSRAVFKFGSWQLKNGKITGMKQKIGQQLPNLKSQEVTAHYLPYKKITLNKLEGEGVTKLMTIDE